MMLLISLCFILILQPTSYLLYAFGRQIGIDGSVPPALDSWRSSLDQNVILKAAVGDQIVFNW